MTWEGKIEIGDTMKSPKFIEHSQLKRFDRVIANPMWNQDSNSLPYLGENFFANDPYERFSDPGTRTSAAIRASSPYHPPAPTGPGCCTSCTR